MLAHLRTTSLLRFLLVASVAGPALILAVSAWITYREAFVNARHELTWTSEIARQHASKVFDSYALVADRVQDSLGDLEGPAVARAEEGLHNRFKGMIAGLPQIQSLIVLDRDGHAQVAVDVFPVDRSIEFADRDYVQALSKPGATTFISRVQTSRISGRRFFGWGRARKSPTGPYDGVVNLAVSPDFFERFYATLVSEVGDSPEGRVVTMLRSDGQVLVRFPPLPGQPPAVPSSNPFFDAVRAQPDGGLYLNRSLVDPRGPQRLFAYRKVPDQPIYIVAGRSVDAITAEWRRNLLRYAVIAISGAGALFLVTLMTLRGAKRETEALAQVQAEMSRRVMAEDHLRQAQKMEAVGQLTGGVAHDFNNMLTVLRSSIDLLKRPNLTDDRRQRYMTAISDTVTRATKLTSQLLAFARRQALKPEVFDVAQSVRALGDLMTTLIGPRVQIEIRAAESPCFIRADPNQFDTALLNLAVNARDAMNGHGTLTVAVATARSVALKNSDSALTGAFVTISVSDTGVGIAPENLGRIFEPFFTTKALGQGTGLGLSQVYGFVKQSGGDVTVESTSGRGTTFVLSMPRVAAVLRPEPSPPETGAALRHDGQGLCVLVVEDDADVGASVTQNLLELGYRSVWTPRAEAALAELASRAEDFDLVFSDVMMPGMNGIDLAKEIRRRHAGLPVILTSGYSEVLAQTGAHGLTLLQKPYAIEQLAEVLRMTAWPRRNVPGPGGAGTAQGPDIDAASAARGDVASGRRETGR